MQRLLDTAPEGYYSHNTGGEHAARVMGDEHQVNALRVKHGLEPHPDLSIFDYAFTNEGYVMSHEITPDGNGAKPELAGYVLARRTSEKYGYYYNLDDLLVDESLRGNGLGKFLLGKLATKGEWGVNMTVYHPNSLRVATDGLAEPTREWLLSRAFHESDGELRLALPGTIMDYVPEKDLAGLIEKMPDDWTGCIGVSPEDEDSAGEMRVYQASEYIGSITRHGGYRYLNGYNSVLMVGYRLQTAHEEQVDGEFSSQFFAAVALLNNLSIQKEPS